MLVVTLRETVREFTVSSPVRNTGTEYRIRKAIIILFKILYVVLDMYRNTSKILTGQNGGHSTYSILGGGGGYMYAFILIVFCVANKRIIFLF
jgi:hypothetical protein